MRIPVYKARNVPVILRSYYRQGLLSITKKPRDRLFWAMFWAVMFGNLAYDVAQSLSRWAGLGLFPGA